VSFSLVVRNARLANGKEETLDIAVADGRIAAIEPRIASDAESLDAGGRFVSAGLVESHFHLDKSRILDRVAALEDRRATDYMKRVSAVKDSFTVEDIYARAKQTLRAREADARAKSPKRCHAHAHAHRGRFADRAQRL
jgi:cytosine/creatinine deaminase